MYPSFSVIPVLDLRGGVVVHAQRGLRQAYQPLRTMLCEGSAPLAIATALLNLYPFDTVYIADLDAIEKRGSHRALIETLAMQYPQVQWWVDDGSTHPWSAKPLNIVQALGTESYPLLPSFREPYVLSLDERAGELLGDTQIHHSPGVWPKRLIAMTLAEVGADLGPNISKISHYCTEHPTHDWYASGGVRDLDDLRHLRRIGAKGVLIATALHQGRITCSDLRRFHEE